MNLLGRIMCFVCAFACALGALGAIGNGFFDHTEIVSNSPFTQPAFADTAIPAVTEPLPPNTAKDEPTETSSPAHKQESPRVEFDTDTDSAPVQLIIPSIDLKSKVIGVGVNSAGDMDVPDGNTKNVGWYKDGPAPGMSGTAVLDAHVFAAFSDLRYVEVGDDIYIMNADHKKLHFVVTDSRVYKLDELSGKTLFGDQGYPALNLITCAGHLTPDHSTYDHRLVVFTKYVGEDD